MQEKQKKNIKARKGKCFLEHLLLAAQAGLAYEKRNCSKMMQDFQSIIPELFHHYSKKLALEDDILHQTISFW